MHRRLFILLALIAMLWNGMAGAMVRHFAASAVDANHAALHFKNIEHHHHESGGYHRDSSKASTAHVAVDVSQANLAISHCATRVDLPSIGSQPPVFLSRPIPSPYLPPLQRPPPSLN